MEGDRRLSNLGIRHLSLSIISSLLLLTRGLSLECGRDRQEIAGICFCIPLSSHPQCRNTTWDGHAARLNRAMSRLKCTQHGYPINHQTAEKPDLTKDLEPPESLTESRELDVSSEKRIRASRDSEVGSDSNSRINTRDIVCECDFGWEGNQCELPLCENGATRNGTRCFCKQGFTGERCDSIDCGQGHWNQAGFCVCEQYWEGKNCNDPECENGGEKVEDPKGGFRCDCPKWYRGDRCQTLACQHGTVKNERCVCKWGYEGEYCDKTACVHGYRNHPSDLICKCYGKWLGYYCDDCFYWRDPTGEHCCPKGKIGKNCDIEYPTDLYELPLVYAARNQETRNLDDTISQSPETPKEVKEKPEWEGVWTNNPGSWSLNSQNLWILISVVIVISLVILTFLFIKFDKWRSKRSTARGYGVYMSQSSHLVQSIDEPYWDPRVNPIARVMSLPAEKNTPLPTYYQSSHSHSHPPGYRCALHGQVPARIYI